MGKIEILALQCFSCKHFSAQQRTKNGKWQCKRCGEKQSILKVYAVSFFAADVRKHIMELNKIQGEGGDVQEYFRTRNQSTQKSIANSKLSMDNVDSKFEKGEELGQKSSHQNTILQKKTKESTINFSEWEQHYEKKLKEDYIYSDNFGDENQNSSQDDTFVTLEDYEGRKTAKSKILAGMKNSNQASRAVKRDSRKSILNNEHPTKRRKLEDINISSTISNQTKVNHRSSEKTYMDNQSPELYNEDEDEYLDDNNIPDIMF